MPLPRTFLLPRMRWFQLIPASNVALVFLLLSAAFTAFLLSLPRKQHATRVLTAFFVLYTLQMLAGFLWLSTYVPWQRVFDVFQGVFALLAVVGYLHFAYAFLGTPFPRETRAVLVGLGAVVVLLSGYSLYQGFLGAFMADEAATGRFPRYNVAPLSLPLLAATYLWTAAVFMRKSLRASHDALPRHDAAAAAAPPGRRAFRALTLLLGLMSPASHGARGLRSFGLLSLLPLLFLLAMFLQRTGLITLQTSLYLGGISNGLFLMGFVVLFVNHAPEPSTLQVKLIGLSMVTVLLILAMIGITMFPFADLAERSGNRPVDFATLRFEPTPEGGYAMRPLDSLRFATPLGQPLALRDDDNQRVALGFAFPFYGRRWDSVHVSANGVLAFGGDVTPPGHPVFVPLRDFYNDRPKIAPFFVDLRPSSRSGVHYRTDGARAVVTWNKVPSAGRAVPNTFQVVLHADGAIDMAYSGIAPLLETGVVGLHPGGDDPPIAALPHAEARAVQAPAGAALVDDYTAHFRAFAHREIRTLTWLILVVAAFILLVFPRFFRHSLVVPLNNLLAGVREANAGNLDVEVPVQVNDEIGFLSMNFNQMAQSMKQAAQTRERLMTMEHELAIAKRIQMSTLPRDFPRHEGIDLFALMRPAREVGGDFYDFFAIDPRRLGFAIGDVSGKGIGAAMFMAMVRTALHATAMQGLSPQACVRHVNRVLFPGSLPQMFVTLVYGLLDLGSGQVAYCNAGHNPPIVLRRDGTTHELPRQANLGVCLAGDFDYRGGALLLAPGEMLFLFTDGVTEAVREDRVRFGEERLRAVLACDEARCPERAVEAVRDAVLHFADGEQQSDDITMLALQYVGDARAGTHDTDGRLRAGVAHA